MTRRMPSVAAVLVAIAILSACGGSNPATYIASARAYLAKNDYNAAIIELKNALKIAPNNGDARFLLARALLDTGNPGDAETEARKAIDFKYPADEATPILVRALMAQGEYRKVVAATADYRGGSARARAEIETQRGLAFLGLSDRTAASAAIDAALAADAGFVPAKMARVQYAMAAGDLAGALAQVDAILAQAPDNVDAVIQKAGLLGRLGRNPEAIVALTKAAAAKPDNAAIRWSLIFALVHEGKLDEAAKEVAAVKAIAAEHPRTWYSEALVAYAQGNVKSARELVERAKHFAPDYLPALYLSGLIDSKLGSLAPAEASLRAVVAKLPEDDDARRALATVYMRRGKSGQALDALEPLLRAAPNDASLLRAAGEIHLAANDPIKAADFFARANKIDGGGIAGRIRLAQVNLMTGDSAQALRELERLAASEPGSIEPDLALISAYLKRREFAKAVAAAAALEKKQPTSAATHNIKGVVFMASGDNRSARASFEKAVAINPDYAAAAFNLARLDLIDKKYEAARTRYQGMLARDPQNETVLLALAELAVVTKSPPAEIAAAIERAIAANPTSVQARLVLISFHASRKDWPAALNAAQKAQAALPDSAPIADAVGMVQYAAGEPNQAIATFKRAAQMQPDNPSPLARQAEIQLKLKDYDGAFEALRTALDAQPDATVLWLTLAGAYVDAGRPAEGIEAARRLQNRRPDRAVGFALEGEIAGRQKRWPEAVAAYRIALARQPSAFVVVRLHAMLDGAGKADEAAAVAQKWIGEHPDDVVVRANLADAAMGRKDYRAAAQQLRSAVAVEPDNILLVNNLGVALGELNDPKALDYAAHAYAMAPNSATTNDTYGWLLVQRGDTARGLELMRRAVELAPADADKRLRLARALVKAGDKDGARKELNQVAKMPSATNAHTEAEKMLKEL